MYMLQNEAPSNWKQKLAVARVDRNLKKSCSSFIPLFLFLPPNGSFYTDFCLKFDSARDLIW